MDRTSTAATAPATTATTATIGNPAAALRPAPSGAPAVPARAAAHGGSGPGSRRHRGLALIVATVVAMAFSLLSFVPAQAYTKAWTGADVNTSGFCGGGTVTVMSYAMSTNQFEWRRVWVYDHARARYTYVSGWEKMSGFNPTKGVYFANAWTSVWVEYADDLGGGRFVYANEWTNFRGSTNCLA